MTGIKKYSIVIVMLLISLALVNCKPAADNSVSQTPEAPRSTETAASPAIDTVNIVAMKFQPAELNVKAGDTVVFINHDMVAHDVTEEYKRWHSSPLQPGESWKMAVTQTANYFCSIHLMMKGKLVIN